MQQLTIRGFGKDVEASIRKLASELDISLNKAALRLLRRGAGLDEPPEARDVIGSSLDHLAGTWTIEEAELMRRVEEDFERIDPELWA